MSNSVSRRNFLGCGLAAAGAAALALPSARAAQSVAVPWNKPPVCVFSKHLQFLDYARLAEAVRKIGCDGVDLTVREKGHVLPERLGEDFPKACETIRGAGLQVAMITTNLRSAEDPHAEDIVKAAAAQQVPFLRVGNHSYGEGPILPQLEQYGKELRSLTALAEAHGVTLGYHNHSGKGNVGAALWDLHEMYADIHSPALGSNLDLGHAKVEGAYGAWEVNTRLLAPDTKMISVKDFVWEGQKPRWVRMGEGIVPTVDMLKILKGEHFNGPVSIHIEYKLPSEEAMIEELGKTTPIVREALVAAGF